MTILQKKNFLLTNGCSFCLGDELTDPKNQHYSKFLAEHLDAEYDCIAANGSSNDRIFRTTMNYIFGAEPGKITHVAIQWSALQRTEYYCDEKDFCKFHLDNSPYYDNFMQLSPYAIELERGYYKRRRQAIREYYTSMFNLETATMHLYNYIETVYNVCRQLNIKVIQGTFHGKMVEDIKSVTRLDRIDDYKDQGQKFAVAKYTSQIYDIVDRVPNDQFMGIYFYSSFGHFVESFNDIGFLEGGHPDEHAHRRWGGYLYDVFQENQCT